MNTLKKILVAGLFPLLLQSAVSQDVQILPVWAEIWQQAKTAEAGNLLESALQLYEKSEQIAKRPEDRLASTEAQFRILRRQKQHTEAETLLREALQRSDFKAPQYRRLLNQLASILLWTPRQNEALDLLNQARFFDTSSENDRYATYNTSAYIYQARGQYEAVIEVMRAWAENVHAHPANQYGAGMLVANAWLKLGFPEKARKSYETALAAGKKVAYKFDYSEAENALQQLSENP